MAVARSFIFDCLWCNETVHIENRFDFRHKYCSADCANMSRQHYLRAIRRRYQNSRKGKFNHARRQKCYRERQKQAKKS